MSTPAPTSTKGGITLYLETKSKTFSREPTSFAQGSKIYVNRSIPLADQRATRTTLQKYATRVWEYYNGNASSLRLTLSSRFISLNDRRRIWAEMFEERSRALWNKIPEKDRQGLVRQTVSEYGQLSHAEGEYFDPKTQTYPDPSAATQGARKTYET